MSDRGGQGSQKAHLSPGTGSKRKGRHRKAKRRGEHTRAENFNLQTDSLNRKEITGTQKQEFYNWERVGYTSNASEGSKEKDSGEDDVIRGEVTR